LTQQSIAKKLGLAVASTVLMILLVLGARWIAGDWVLDAEWATRAGEVDPYSLDGLFTVSGTWLGMLGGFVILTETKGHFLAGKGGWRRLVRFLVGLVGVFVLYFGLGQIFSRDADFASFALRFFRYTLIGLWVSWLGPVVFEKLRILKFAEKQKQDEAV